MTENNYIAAIDIGGSKVVVAVGDVAPNGEVQILAAYSEPMDGEAVRNGEVRNVINLQNKVKKCLDNIKEEEGFVVDKAIINLSGAHIQCVDFDYTINIRNAAKQVTKSDLDELLTEAINKHTYDNFYIVDIIPQAYYVDGIHVTSPLGTIGKKIKGEFCVMVCDRTHKVVFDQIFSSLNITPLAYTLSALASAEAVLLDDEREYGVAMIDIGSDCCDIVVYKDNIPCDLGVVPLGGRNINEDIASLKVLPRYIESIKINYARALAENADYNKVISLPIKSDNINKRVIVRELCGVVEARVREIAEEVMRFLEDGGHFRGLGAGIVLTGGCSKLQDIDVVFKDVTGYDNVVVRYPNMAGQENSEVLNDPEYATVVGLLMNGKFLITNQSYRNGVSLLTPNEPEIPTERFVEPVIEITDERYILKEEKEEVVKVVESVKQDIIIVDDAPEEEVEEEEEEYEDEDDLYEEEEEEEEEREHKSPLKSFFGRFKLSEPKDDVNDLDQ